MRRRSREIITAATVLLVVAAMAFAFWPRPTNVDIGEVRRGDIRVTIDEQGRTRVRDTYVVSAPVAGRLLRVEVEPGDQVVRGQTIIAQMLPANPAALDIRTREQARASVSAAQAALRLARAEFNKATADADYAQEELTRNQQLAQRGIASEAVLDRARSESRKAAAALDTAEAAIAMREAELANARARLIHFDDRGLATALNGETQIPLRAPASGRILRVIQQSETTLSAGTQIMEIGNIEEDLEVIVELLSTDAVKVSPDDPVIVRDWGGEEELQAIVERIDPFGFTKFSALGVEEQRVNAVVHFISDREAYSALGHGFRVEVNIVVWQAQDAVVAPSSALFRDAGAWSAFVVKDGKAKKTRLELGRNNGIDAQITSGLSPGDRVILYPSATIEDGMAVQQRTTQ